MKTLILFAHPALQKSKANLALIEGLDQMEDVTFRDLYELYPDFDIDVKLEQELVAKHKVIVFHFPLFWYSTPAILKEWQDLVLQHGWAYGSQGNALKDKIFFCAITTGGEIEGYREGDFHNHTLFQLLSPLRQTAALCKMKPIPPFVIAGTNSMKDQELQECKRDYHTLVSCIACDSFDVTRVNDLEFLNDYLVNEER